MKKIVYARHMFHVSFCKFQHLSIICHFCQQINQISRVDGVISQGIMNEIKEKIGIAPIYLTGLLNVILPSNTTINSGFVILHKKGKVTL